MPVRSHKFTRPPCF